MFIGQHIPKIEDEDNGDEVVSFRRKVINRIQAPTLRNHIQVKTLRIYWKNMLWTKKRN